MKCMSAIETPASDAIVGVVAGAGAGKAAVRQPETSMRLRNARSNWKPTLLTGACIFTGD